MPAATYEFRGKLHRFEVTDEGWQKTEIQLPGLGSVGLSALSDESNDFFITYNSSWDGPTCQSSSPVSAFRR